MDEFLTLKETLGRLKVSRATLYRMMDRGELASSKVGKLLRFRESDIEACFKSKEIPNEKANPQGNA